MSAEFVRRVPRRFSDTLMVAPLSVAKKGTLVGSDIAKFFRALAMDQKSSQTGLERIVEQTGNVLGSVGLPARVDAPHGSKRTLDHVRASYGETHVVRMAAEAQHHALRALHYVGRIEAKSEALATDARMAVAHAMAARTVQWSHHIVHELEEPTRDARRREQSLRDGQARGNAAAKMAAQKKHGLLQTEADKIWAKHPELTVSAVARLLQRSMRVSYERIRKVIKKPPAT